MALDLEGPAYDQTRFTCGSCQGCAHGAAALAAAEQARVVGLAADDGQSVVAPRARWSGWDGPLPKPTDADRECIINAGLIRRQAGFDMRLLSGDKQDCLTRARSSMRIRSVPGPRWKVRPGVRDRCVQSPAIEIDRTRIWHWSYVVWRAERELKISAPLFGCNRTLPVSLRDWAL
jgi:hypothetical protein